MCFGCHDLASRKQDQKKIELAEKYGVPLVDSMPNKQKNVHIQALNRAATTILKAGQKIPEAKLQMLKQIITSTIADNRELMADCVPEEIMKQAVAGEYTQEMLNFASGMRQYKLSNRDKQNPHGQKIVQIYSDNGQLHDFIRMWRQHFLDNN